MTSEIALAPSAVHPERATAEPAKLPRLWPAVVLVSLYWTVHVVTAQMELLTFTRFISRLAISVLLTLSFLLWWLFSRRIAWRERLQAVAAAVGGGCAAPMLYHPTVGLFGTIFVVPPWLVTVWTIWLLIARRASARTRRIGLPIVLLLTWAAFALVRINGINGEQVAEYHWRWTPTAEELYQQERDQRQSELPARSVSDGSTSDQTHLEPGDWPGFRGPNRDGVVRGEKIVADWKTNPPKKRWRQRVGPGWSSMVVVGDRLFTQEQRGPSEAVVCLEAATGRELWAHEDAVRFEESVAGAGPRATPTFADGRIYTLGASGILNCLDAVRGERKWFHDIVADSGAKPPQWGFSSSPLVVDNKVVVFAGGEGDKGLLAYDAETGQLAWTAPAGQLSYSSPQRALLHGKEQILFWSERGLTAVDPASGKVLWRHGEASPRALCSLQPHVTKDGRVLISSESAVGTVCVDVKRDGDVWTTSRHWSCKRLQPSFNDFVLHDGSIYGFDGALFCCVDLQTGSQRWKDGRYGHGQVLLLADSALLVITAEDGQVVLLSANAEEHKELGRFQAVGGKVWNHAVVAHGRLYVRSDEEMACYELEMKESR